MDVGEVKGTITIDDGFTATFNAFKAGTSAIVESIPNVDKITEAYRKLTATLDPVVAGQQKYERAQQTLDAALTQGVITQDQYTQALDRAREKFTYTEQNANSLRSKLDELANSVDGFGQHLNELGNKFDSVNSFGESLKETIFELAAVLGIGLSLDKIIEDTIASGDAQAQLAAGLRSVGSITGETSSKLEALSRNLQDTTKYSKTQIEQAESLGLTFTHVSSSVFPAYLKAAADISARTGEDFPSAVQKLGRAIDTGMVTSLKRAGITFDAQATAQAKYLVETGQYGKEAELVLDAVEKKLNGSAAAARDTLGGAMQLLKNRVEEFAISVGTAMTPALKELGNTLSQVLDDGNTLAVELGTRLGSAIKLLAGSIDFISQHAAVFKALLAGFVTYESVVLIEALYGWVIKLVESETLLAALNPFALAIAAAAALIIYVQKLNDEVAQSQGQFEAELAGDKLLANLKLATNRLTEAEYEHAQSVIETNKKYVDQLSIQLAIAEQALKSERESISYIQEVKDGWNSLKNLFSGGLNLNPFAIATSASTPQAPKVESDAEQKTHQLSDTISALNKNIAESEARLKSLKPAEDAVGDSAANLSKAEQAALDTVEKSIVKYHEAADAELRLVEVAGLDRDARAAIIKQNEIDKALMTARIELAKVKLNLDDQSNAKMAALRNEIVKYVGTLADAKKLLEDINKTEALTKTRYDDQRTAVEALNAANAKLADLGTGLTENQDKEADLRTIVTRIIKEQAAGDAELTQKIIAETEAHRTSINVYREKQKVLADNKLLIDAAIAADAEEVKSQAEIADLILNHSVPAWAQNHDALRQTIEDQEFLAAVRHAQHTLSEQELEDLDNEIKRRNAAKNNLADYITQVKKSDDLFKPWKDGAQQTGDLIASDLSGALQKVFDTNNTIVDGFIKIWADALSKWLENWIATMIEAKTAQQSLNQDGGVLSGWSGGVGNNTTGGYTSSSSSGASLGTYGAIIGAMVAITILANDYDKALRPGGFGNAGSVGISGSSFNQLSYMDAQSKGLTDEIEKIVTAWEATTGIAIQSMDRIGIKVENDGKKFKSYIGDTFVGMFDTLDQAITAAFQVGLKNAKFLGTLPDVLKHYLDGLSAGMIGQIDGSQLAANMKTITDALNQNLNQIALDFRNFNSQLDQQIQAQHDLLGSGSDFSQLFQQDIIHYTQNLKDMRDQITGQTKSQQEIRLEQAHAFNDEIKLRRIDIQLQMDDVQTKLLAMGVTIGLLQSLNQAVSESGDGGGRRDNGTGPQFDDNGHLINPANPQNQAIREQTIHDLEALYRQLQAELAALPAEIQDSELANIAKGNGAGSANAKQLIQMLAQDARGQLDPLQQAIQGVNDRYAQEVALAGKNADAIALAVKYRDLEIAAIQKQARLQIEKTTDPLIASGQGVSGQQQTLNDALRQETLDANAYREAGGAAWKVHLAYAEKYREMGQSAIASLNLPIETLQAHFHTLGDTLSFLSSNLKTLNLSASDFSRVAGELGTQEFVSLADSLSQWSTDTQDAIGLNKIKWDLERAQLIAQVAMLEVLDTQFHVLSDGMKETLDRLVAGLPVDPPPGFGNTGNGAGSQNFTDPATVLSLAAQQQQNAASALTSSAQALSQAIQKLTDYENSLLTNSSLSPLTPSQQRDEALRQLRADYSSAAGGNIDSLNAFQGLANTFLQLDRSLNPSNSTYSVDFRSVISMLDSLRGLGLPGTPVGLPTIPPIGTTYSGSGSTGTGSGSGSVSGSSSGSSYTINLDPVVLSISSASSRNHSDLSDIAARVSSMTIALQSQQAALDRLASRTEHSL